MGGFDMPERGLVSHWANRKAAIEYARCQYLPSSTICAVHAGRAVEAFNDIRISCGLISSRPAHLPDTAPKTGQTEHGLIAVPVHTSMTRHCLSLFHVPAVPPTVGRLAHPLAHPRRMLSRCKLAHGLISIP